MNNHDEQQSVIYRAAVNASVVKSDSYQLKLNSFHWLRDKDTITMVGLCTILYLIQNEPANLHQLSQTRSQESHAQEEVVLTFEIWF